MQQVQAQTTNYLLKTAHNNKICHYFNSVLLKSWVLPVPRFADTYTLLEIQPPTRTEPSQPNTWPSSLPPHSLQSQNQDTQPPPRSLLLTAELLLSVLRPFHTAACPNSKGSSNLCPTLSWLQTSAVTRVWPRCSGASCRTAIHLYIHLRNFILLHLKTENTKHFNRKKKTYFNRNPKV